MVLCFKSNTRCVSPYINTLTVNNKLQCLAWDIRKLLGYESNRDEMEWFSSLPYTKDCFISDTQIQKWYFRQGRDGSIEYFSWFLYSDTHYLCYRAISYLSCPVANAYVACKFSFSKLWISILIRCLTQSRLSRQQRKPAPAKQQMIYLSRWLICLEVHSCFY